MNDHDRAGALWQGLNDCRALDDDLTVTTVTHWLEYHGAGYPDVALFQEKIRDDARFWAASAHQAELEAYMAAAIAELEASSLTRKAMKRLAALAWRRMAAEDKAKFKEWIGENKE